MPGYRKLFSGYYLWTLVYSQASLESKLENLQSENNFFIEKVVLIMFFNSLFPKYG